jgi:hypothetical protein
MQKVAMFDQSVVKGDVSKMDDATPDYMDNKSGTVVYEDYQEAEEIKNETSNNEDF